VSLHLQLRLSDLDSATTIFATTANVRRECTMAERERKTWRELCRAALEAKDPNELLKIVEELSKVLKHEEQIRRDFREATRASKSYADTNMSRISRYSRLETDDNL